MSRTGPTGWNTPLTQVPPRRAHPGFITSGETYWREYVRGRLRSVTRALGLVIAIAGIALGIAVGLLVSELRQRDTDRARVTTLERQVTDLQAQIRRLERRSPAR